ncbi:MULTISPECIES: hypothetical protein [unclassified Mycoplasma]|uniref:hypothetical protein n=1 Tax=unclassified Mycoplasma TaxID=2683645 RepID=UPI00197B1EEB|nr:MULTISPECIES: hypothetical protein [unclassified Mycoplasma]MBN4084651.1 hypothetical protein [Mycoplasma sp. CSL10166]MBU4693130.1 hypothetical protein [Mycoplasma sp. CSL7491-lung]
MTQNTFLVLIALTVIISIKFLFDVFKIKKYYDNGIIYKFVKKWFLNNFLILATVTSFAIIMFSFVMTGNLSIIKNDNNQKNTLLIWEPYNLALITFIVLYLPTSLLNLYYVIITKVNTNITKDEVENFDIKKLQDYSVDRSYILIKSRRKKISDQEIRFKDVIYQTFIWRRISKHMLIKSLIKKSINFALRGPKKIKTNPQNDDDINQLSIALMLSAIDIVNNIYPKLINKKDIEKTIEKVA